jgi:hypothetical protein
MSSTRAFCASGCSTKLRPFCVTESDCDAVPLMTGSLLFPGGVRFELELLVVAFFFLMLRKKRSRSATAAAMTAVPMKSRAISRLESAKTAK